MPRLIAVAAVLALGLGVASAQAPEEPPGPPGACLPPALPSTPAPTLTPPPSPTVLTMPPEVRDAGEAAMREWQQAAAVEWWRAWEAWRRATLPTPFPRGFPDPVLVPTPCLRGI
jgi:hypothetical protein